jgi:HlyD family secretion protein
MKHGSCPMVRSALILSAACLLFASCAKESGLIEASGTIETTDVRVSSRTSGEVVRLEGDEGLAVRAGDLLAEIDHEALDLQLGQARSGVDFAKAQLQLLVKGARAEDIVQTQEQLNQANENLKTAQDDDERMESLLASGSATKKQRDDAATRLTVAKAQVNAAKQALLKLENLARPEEVKSAEAKVEQAEFSVKLLEKSIADCSVTSPIDGVVTRKLVEKGELAAPNTGLFIVTDLREATLTIYVPETDLGRVRVGQEARISVDSFPGKGFPGRVTFISPTAEFTPKTIQTKDERVKLVYGVKISIANPDGIFKPGMPADARLVPTSGSRDSGDPK